MYFFPVLFSCCLFSLFLLLFIYFLQSINKTSRWTRDFFVILLNSFYFEFLISIHSRVNCMAGRMKSEHCRGSIIRLLGIQKQSTQFKWNREELRLDPDAMKASGRLHHRIFCIWFSIKNAAKLRDVCSKKMLR